MLVVDQNSEDDQEEYESITDGFGVDKSKDRTPEENAMIRQISYADLGDNVNIEKRKQEERQLLLEDKQIESMCYERTIVNGGRYKMIAVNEHNACAFKLHPDDETIRDSIVVRDYQVLEALLEKCKTQLQCTVMIQDCNTKLVRGLGDPQMLQDFIAKASEKRETFPKPVDLREIAEHPIAIAAARHAMHEVEPVKTHPSCTGKEYPLKNHSVTIECSKKKKKRYKAREETAEDSVERFIIAIRIAKRNETWDTCKPLGKCKGNAVASLWENELCIADQLWDTCWVTRVRTYNLLDKSLIRENTIVDKYHMCGKLKHVAQSCKNHTVLTFDSRVLLVTSSKVSTFTFDRAICENATYMKQTNEIVVASKEGSIYLLKNQKETSLRHIDMPLKIPVLGLQVFGPVLCAWDHRSVYRFHPSSDIIQPYVFDCERPTNTYLCGSLMCSLNAVGDIWLTHTLQTEISRQLTPPELIAKKIVEKNDAGSETNEKGERISTFFDLFTPVTYEYQAVHLARTTVTILYPCGLVRKISLK